MQPPAGPLQSPASFSGPLGQPPWVAALPTQQVPGLLSCAGCGQAVHLHAHRCPRVCVAAAWLGLPKGASAGGKGLRGGGTPVTGGPGLAPPGRSSSGASDPGSLLFRPPSSLTADRPCARVAGGGGTPGLPAQEVTFQAGAGPGPRKGLTVPPAGRFGRQTSGTVEQHVGSWSRARARLQSGQGRGP